MKRKVIMGSASFLFFVFVVVAFLVSIGFINLNKITGFAVAENYEISTSKITGMASFNNPAEINTNIIGVVGIFIVLAIITLFIMKKFAEKV